MPDKKISELSAAGALSGTELVEVVKGGINVQTTTQDIADLGGGGTTIPFGVTSGSGTYTVTMSPVVSSYVNGSQYIVRIGTTSSGVVTIDMGPGAKKVLMTSGVQASSSYMIAGVDYLLSYNSALDSAAGAFVVVNELLHGYMNARGDYDASSNLFPAAGGSGVSGGIRHGDIFRISVAGTLGGTAVSIGDFVTTSVDNPGQTASNWYLIPGYASIVGVQDIFVPAAAMWPRITGGCSQLTAVEMTTSLFNVQVLAFDQAAQEFAQFQVVLPRKWNNGTVTVVPYWTAQSGSGTVQWGISGGAYSNDDALTVALGSPQTSDDTLIATNDLHVGPATSAITLAGTPADADFLAFQISRNPASDTLSADALLLGIVVRITTDAAIDS